MSFFMGIYFNPSLSLGERARFFKAAFWSLQLWDPQTPGEVHMECLGSESQSSNHPLGATGLFLGPFSAITTLVD